VRGGIGLPTASAALFAIILPGGPKFSKSHDAAAMSASPASTASIAYAVLSMMNVYCPTTGNATPVLAKSLMTRPVNRHTIPAMGQEYYAFISYNHRDEAAAKWLHKKLETYRFPRRLIGRETQFGLLPRSLTPIFRDREELSAGPSLPEKVQQALAVSHALLVICSPHAAASAWVNREIEEFRALHPERPILLALVDGSPETAFPPAITAAAGAPYEPLAANLQPEVDGRRLGLLKLLAGLVNVPLGELVQRDAQRKMRRVMAVTVAALLAVAILATSMVMAVQARHEAERQRASAEGLIEFMLTDLRERLEGVGRLDVLSSVNRRALSYYKQQDIDELPVESLERRTRILLAMGEDDERRGDMKRALAQFEEAARTTGALLAQQPNDPQRIYSHAQSEFWVGLIAWRTQRIDAAQKAFERYEELAFSLIERDALNPDWLMEAGYASSNLATLLLRDRVDAVAAEKRFHASLGLFQTALRLKPGDEGIRWDISDSHGWMADSYRAQGRYDEALVERKRQKAILHGLLAGHPRNARYQRDVLTSDFGIALIELDSGANADAERHLRAAYYRAADLAAQDRTNEKLEQQRIAAGLFLLKAILRNNPFPSPAVLREGRSLLADCGVNAARGDAELRHFCEVLTARVEGRKPSIELSGIDAKGRLSPRWGIDFAAELRNGVIGWQAL
jgi:hypothetical protein